MADMTWFQVFFWLTIAVSARLMYKAWRWTWRPGYDTTELDRLHESTVRVITFDGQKGLVHMTEKSTMWIPDLDAIGTEKDDYAEDDDT